MSRRHATHIAAAGLIGLVFGVFIGMNLHPAVAPPCPEGPAWEGLGPTVAGRPSPPATRVGPPAVDLDLGSVAAKPALLGTWTTLADPDGRAAAVTTTSPARLLLSATPGGAADLVVIVAKLTGTAPGESLDVTASVRGHRIASWSLDSEWGLYSAPWPRGLSLERNATLALALPAVPDAGAHGAGVGIAVDHLRVAGAAATGELDLQTVEGRSRLLEGFWQVEDNAQQGEPAVWSRGGRSTLGLVLTPAAGDYSLELRAGAFDAIAPVETTVEINGKSLGSLPIDALDDYVFTVPRAALVAGANTVELVYAKTGRPADHGSGDPRELAVRLFHVTLTPVGS